MLKAANLAIFVLRFMSPGSQSSKSKKKPVKEAKAARGVSKDGHKRGKFPQTYLMQSKAIIKNDQ